MVMKGRASHLVEIRTLLEDLIVQRMRRAAAGLAYMALSHPFTGTRAPAQ
jgi:hypothetical protein